MPAHGLKNGGARVAQPHKGTLFSIKKEQSTDMGYSVMNPEDTKK